MQTADYDIAVDFMDMTNDGRLWTRIDDLRPGFVPIVGQYAVAGCDDADAAVARIISVDLEDGILLQVLDGGVDEHRHLLTTAWRSLVRSAPTGRTSAKEAGTAHWLPAPSRAPAP